MPHNPLLEDLLALGRDLFGSLMDARHELKAEAKKRVGSVTRKLDIVARDEFDAAFAMLAKMRDRQEELAARVAKIEAHLKLRNSVKTKKQNLRILKDKRAPRGRKK